MDGPAEPPEDDTPDNYLGPWLATLGIKRKTILERTGYGKSYLSLLISNKRRPSIRAALVLSEAAGITVNQMYRPPPPKSAVKDARALKPDQIARIAEVIAETRIQ